MDEVLYHPEIFMPDWFEMPTERAVLRYSNHALRSLNNDRYGAIPQFPSIPLCRFRLVELGVKDGRASKIVVRGKFSDVLDLVFVLIPRDNGDYFVKTCWFNRCDDLHTTLRRERYASA